MLWQMEEVVSDMSAVHHLLMEPEAGDYAGLSGARFLKLAERLVHYPGAVRGVARIQAHQAELRRPPDVGTAVTPEMLAAGAFAGKIAYRRTDA